MIIRVFLKEKEILFNADKASTINKYIQTTLTTVPKSNPRSARNSHINRQHSVSHKKIILH